MLMYIFRQKKILNNNLAPCCGNSEDAEGVVDQDRCTVISTA